MADLFHMWGNDLTTQTPTGDLLTVGGNFPEQPNAGNTVQRLLRRLLTNPGEVWFHPFYGAGIARFLGQPINVKTITAIIRSQIFLEAAVAQSPAPVITVRAQKDGTVSCSILYTDALTGRPTPVQFVLGS